MAEEKTSSEYPYENSLYRFVCANKRKKKKKTYMMILQYDKVD